jgi:hypothetical protein
MYAILCIFKLFIYIGQLLDVSHGDIIHVWEIPDLNIEITVYIYI